jgi:hypothetical protein
MAVIMNIKGPKGDPGDPGNDGDPGADGQDGSKWYSGSSAPSDSTGIDGDFYLNTTTGDVSVKTGGTWA